jgi:hypothetical protein
MLNHPPELDRAELLNRLVAFTDDVEQGDNLSDDSSGTDISSSGPTRPKLPERRSKQVQRSEKKNECLRPKLPNNAADVGLGAEKCGGGDRKIY